MHIKFEPIRTCIPVVYDTDGTFFVFPAYADQITHTGPRKIKIGMPPSFASSHANSSGGHASGYREVNVPAGRVLITGTWESTGQAFPPRWMIFSNLEAGSNYELMVTGDHALQLTKLPKYSNETSRGFAQARWSDDVPLCPLPGPD